MDTSLRLIFKTHIEYDILDNVLRMYDDTKGMLTKWISNLSEYSYNVKQNKLVVFIRTEFTTPLISNPHTIINYQSLCFYFWLQN